MVHIYIRMHINRTTRFKCDLNSLNLCLSKLFFHQSSNTNYISRKKYLINFRDQIEKHIEFNFLKKCDLTSNCMDFIKNVFVFILFYSRSKDTLKLAASQKPHRAHCVASCLQLSIVSIKHE